MKPIFRIVLAAFWVTVFSNYAFAPYSLHYLVWIAPWGLFYLESRYRGEYKKLFWIGVFVSIVFYSFSFYWIIHMTVTFGGFPLFLAIPIFLISAIALNLWFPFFLIFFSWGILNARKWFAWLSGFICLLGEFFTPQIFPWYWGNIVAGSTILSQTAEYFSVYGLSFVLFVVSYSLYSLFGKDILISLTELRRAGVLRQSKNLKYFFHSLGKFTPVFGLFVFFFCLGYFLYWKWNRIEPVEYLDTVMIQPNAPLEFRDGRSVAETMKDLMERIERLAEEAASSHPDPIDLIVLPESGVPFYSTHRHEATIYPPIYWDQFDSLMFILANRYHANVFFNELDASYARQPKTRENLRYYNSSTLYDPNGSRTMSYQKVFLLIFGEYMPFEFLYALSPQTGRFEPGTNLNLIRVYKPKERPEWNKPHIRFEDTYLKRRPEVGEYYSTNRKELKIQTRFLPLICYEVIIPEFVRRFRASGNPGLIVNVTNDKWYGISAESFQHGDLARIRSIEWRKWMVRSTNSGTSFFVDHLGRVVEGRFTGQETSEFLREKVGIMESPPTFYVRHGNLLVWLILGFCTLAFGYRIYQIRRV